MIYFALIIFCLVIGLLAFFIKLGAVDEKCEEDRNP